MSDRDRELRRRQRPGKRRVGISVDEHYIGPLALHHRLEPCQHRAGLFSVGSASHAQMMFRGRNRELLEEHGRHLMVVMLPGVHEDFFVAATQHGAHRRRLDELWARADDGQESHRRA